MPFSSKEIRIPDYEFPQGALCVFQSCKDAAAV